MKPIVRDIVPISGVSKPDPTPHRNKKTQPVQPWLKPTLLSYDHIFLKALEDPKNDVFRLGRVKPAKFSTCSTRLARTAQCIILHARDQAIVAPLYF